MTQHQETMPRVRIRLYLRDLPKVDEWEVWELWDKVPPSAACELESPLLAEGPRGEAQETSPSPAERQCRLPGVVLEVESDATVQAWPGPDVA